MTKPIKIILLAALVAWSAAGITHANPVFKTRVRVIQAGTGAAHVDPGLGDLTRELQSVFRYTSYRLIQTRNMDLRKKQEGRLPLPGGRNLVITPSGMEGKRITYGIRIDKKNRPVFRTRIALQNNRSITIGGPKAKNGVLLLNISGSVR